MSNPPITYITGHVPNPSSVFRTLWDELAWVRHPLVPRREYFVSRIGKPYAYGAARFARTYTPQPSHPLIDKLWTAAEEGSKTTFDVCFLNGYVDAHDHLGWHADDSPEMDDDRPIAVVSVMEFDNESREIWFRPQADKLDVTKLSLASGSLVVMTPGMQDTHFHRIPKASFVCHGRVSLTFRGYKDP